MKTEILAAGLAALLATGAASAADPQDSRIRSEFTAFAGSPENADSLVGGLRNGTPITLSSTDAKGVTTTTTFNPATGKLGQGNVNIALAVARQQLTNAGITQPTAQQIQASLIGGTVTKPNGDPVTLQGVTTLRAQGMGWGKIAHNLGFKLGPVVSATKTPQNHGSAPTTVLGTNSTGSSGVTTAAGPSASQGNGNGIGRGITTGAGGPAGQGHGNAFGHGVTTGAGGASVQSGGLAKGAGKGS